MTARRLTTAVLATGAAAALTAGCSSQHSGPDPSISPDRSTHQTRTAAGHSGSPQRRNGPVIPSESPRPTRAASSPTTPADPGISTPAIPAVEAATRSPLAVAKAWAIAANSSSYRDPVAGTWTERAKPFVTGAEAAAELEQHSGGGGSTWAQIQASKCVTSLRQLGATIPSDAPTGPERHVVYLTATVTLACATGQIQLSPLAAQLIVTRVHGRWLVADVHH